MAASSRIKGITIEIGGDTTKLTKALSSVDNSIRNTQNNIRDLDKALKLDPGNTDLIKDKQKALATEIDATKEKIQKEKEAFDQLKNTDGFDANSKQAQNLKTQIDLDTAALKELQKEAASTSSVFGTHMQLMGEKVAAVGDKIKTAGDNLKKFGQNMTAKVTTPIAAGFGAVIKTTADYEAEMSKVQAISGANADEMEQLKSKAREMGEQTKFSATESGQAFEYMAMAGWKTEDMLDGIEGIMNLAAASGEELGTASDIVTDALTAFGLSAEDSGRFADILAAAASNANTNVSMMGESFKYVAPVAGALGYSMEDVAIALGLMANSGIKADMAGTSLRNMFNRMAKPTKESAEAMDRLGVALYDDEGKMYTFREIMDTLRKSFGEINMTAEEYDNRLDILDQALEDGTLTQKKYDKELEELNKQAFGAEGAEKARAAAMLGGTRAMSGLLAIANASVDDYQQLTNAIDNSSQAMAMMTDGSIVPLNEALESGQEIVKEYDGAAAAMAGTMLDNVSGDVTILLSQLQELAISLGELLMPLLREITGMLQDAVTWLNSLDDDTKQTIMTVAAVVAAVGPVLIIIGSVVSAIGSIVGGIGTLITVGGTIVTFLTGTLIPAVGGVVAAMAPAIAAVAAPIAIAAAIVAAIILIATHWDQIKEKAIEIKDKVKDAWDKLKENTKKSWEDIKDKTKENWDKVKDKIKETWENIKTNVKEKVDKVKSDLKEKWESIKQDIQTKVTNIKEKVAETFQNMKDKIKEKVSNIKEDIKEGFQKAIDWIKDLPNQALEWGRDIIGGLIDGIKEKVGGIGEAVGGVAETIADYIHFSEPEKGALSNFHTFMPDMMKQLASGIDKGIPKIEDAMSNLSSAMVPTMQGAKNNTYNGGINITINGAQGQDVNQLADIIQQRMNIAIQNQEAVFA